MNQNVLLATKSVAVVATCYDVANTYVGVINIINKVCDLNEKVTRIRYYVFIEKFIKKNMKSDTSL